ncbi:MAG: ATP-binding cassette domain-containing protein [Lachnospiraceae bacterium]|nr:ATP-binding cassette domain-containing protein [Lachnospiraceae bacterium]
MIELKDVSFSYDNKLIINNLSLNIKKGDKIGIMGESGCGKSTLLRLMAGLYRTDKGTVTVDGESDPQDISRKVSVVMQSPMLLPLSIYDNITMGHKYPDSHVEKVVKMARLSSWIETLPEGIHTYLGDRADELSGGQAQRIAIARAMCKNSEVLLLDEPASALDSENSASVLEAIMEYATDKTVVHVTHQAKHLEGYTKIYVLRNGELA